jgi:NTP pyrophosphatase (non-canonical NTP hydrolase)
VSGDKPLDRYQPVDMEGYADRVLTTAQPPVVAGGAARNMSALVHAAMGLASEGGEMIDAVKRAAFYGQTLDRTNIIEEAGDALWYIAYALRCVGATFEEAVLANIAKLDKRYAGTFSLEKSVNRDTGAERAAMESASGETKA